MNLVADLKAARSGRAVQMLMDVGLPFNTHIYAAAMNALTDSGHADAAMRL